MFALTVTVICLALMIGSIKQMFHSLDFREKVFSFQIFISLMLLYTIVMIGFGIIYTVLSIHGSTIFVEVTETHPILLGEELGRSMYFSGITLFTVGYGDLTPVGIGRWIALLEAMIGYTIPAALVVNAWQTYKADP